MQCAVPGGRNCIAVSAQPLRRLVCKTAANADTDECECERIEMDNDISKLNVITQSGDGFGFEFECLTKVFCFLVGNTR